VTRRRLSLWTVLCLAIASLPGAGKSGEGTAQAANSGRPNLLVILTDDQDLVLESMQAMPRVRKLLGDEGVTFTEATVPLSSCCPARTTLLRGQYAHNHGVYSNQLPDGGFARFQALGLERKTIATALRAAGYRTGFFGKYLNGYPEGASPRYVPAGWDEWASPASGDAYGQFDYTLNVDGRLVEHAHAPEDYLTDVLAQRGRKFLADWAGHQAFFMVVAPYAPHKPYVPAPRHAELFADVHAPRGASFNERDVSDKPAKLRKLAPLGTRAIAELDEIYRDRLRSLVAVDEMDAALVDELAARGELERTYIVFTSDNGYHLGQHRLPAGKFTAYEEDVRVPLVVRGPGVEKGAARAHLVSQVDIAPTLAELGGARLAVAPDGRSFAALLRPDAPPPAAWRRFTLVEQFSFRPAAAVAGEARLLEPAEPAVSGFQEYPTYRGLRGGGFKYIEAAAGRELYDLERDPFELDNRAGALSRGERLAVSKLLQRLAACRGAECWQIEAGPPPDLR
jgi:N-acetylglucosamine-6-sulfatase